MKPFKSLEELGPFAVFIGMQAPAALCPSSYLFLSSVDLSDTKSVSLDYEPSSEPLHISAKQLSTSAPLGLTILDNS